jgi:hypothetical protein
MHHRHFPESRLTVTHTVSYAKVSFHFIGEGSGAAIGQAIAAWLRQLAAPGSQ